VGIPGEAVAPTFVPFPNSNKPPLKMRAYSAVEKFWFCPRVYLKCGLIVESASPLADPHIQEHSVTCDEKVEGM
jgi:hypothetical protein